MMPYLRSRHRVHRPSKRPATRCRLDVLRHRPLPLDVGGGQGRRGGLLLLCGLLLLGRLLLLLLLLGRLLLLLLHQERQLLQLGRLLLLRLQRVCCRINGVARQAGAGSSQLRRVVAVAAATAAAALHGRLNRRGDYTSAEGVYCRSVYWLGSIECLDVSC